MNTQQLINRHRPAIYSPFFRTIDLKRGLDFRRTGHKTAYHALLRLRREIENHELSEIRLKRAHRRDLKQIQDSLINPVKQRTPFILDYFLRKGTGMQIYKDRIYYGSGRNHWAKNDQDFRLLKILLKNK